LDCEHVMEDARIGIPVFEFGEKKILEDACDVNM
jgi:hypothetical protein